MVSEGAESGRESMEELLEEGDGDGSRRVGSEPLGGDGEDIFEMVGGWRGGLGEML